MTQVTVNGNTYSDDGTTTKDMNNGGFRTWLFPMIQDTMTDTSGKVSSAAAQVVLATAQANAAAASALTAVNAPGTQCTSSTSFTIGNGSKTFTTQSGKSIVVGMTFVAASSGTPSATMLGTVTAYSGTSLTINFTSNTGSGTFTDWQLSLAAAGGATLGANTYTGKQAMNGAAIDESKAANVASAATIDLTSITGNLVHITGTTTITAITIPSGAERTVVFDGILTLTNNATTLILPGGVNITTAVGDSMIVRGDGAGNSRVIDYCKASGLPTVLPTINQYLVLLNSTTISSPVATVDFLSIFSSTYDNYIIFLEGLAVSANDFLSIRFANAGAADTGSNYISVNPNSTATAAGASILLSGGILAGGNGASGSMVVVNANGSLGKQFQTNITEQGTGSYNNSAINGMYINSAVVSGFRLYLSGANNITGGTIKVFGYRNS